MVKYYRSPYIFSTLGLGPFQTCLSWIISLCPAMSHLAEEVMLRELTGHSIHWFVLLSVSLRGTVIIIANHGDRIDIPAGAVLENKIVSGNLRILDH